MKRLVAFDLDGTLAESKQALDDEMAAILGRLSHVADICVISGGDWPQFDKQVASRLPDSTNRSRFWLMPTTGTKLYRFENGQWARRYADLFSDEDRAHSEYHTLLSAPYGGLNSPQYAFALFSRSGTETLNDLQLLRSYEPPLTASVSRRLRSGESRSKTAGARLLSRPSGKSVPVQSTKAHLNV